MTILKTVLMMLWIFCFYQGTLKNIEVFVFAKLRKESVSKASSAAALVLIVAASVFFAIWFYL